MATRVIQDLKVTRVGLNLDGYSKHLQVSPVELTVEGKSQYKDIGRNVVLCTRVIFIVVPAV